MSSSGSLSSLRELFGGAPPGETGGDHKAPTFEEMRFSDDPAGASSYHPSSDTYDGEPEGESGFLEDSEGDAVMSDDGSKSKPEGHKGKAPPVMDQKKAALRDSLRTDEQRLTRSAQPSEGASRARECLEFYTQNRSFQPARSWCVFITLQPTKGQGYHQISFEGVNKFVTLGELLLWCRGDEKLVAAKHLEDTEYQVSHLCHNPRCMIPDHVVSEPIDDNNARKNCGVWVGCSTVCRACSGSKVIMICPHVPKCIKWKQGYNSMEELVANGVCRDDGEYIKNELWFRKTQHDELETPSELFPSVAGPAAETS